MLVISVLQVKVNMSGIFSQFQSFLDSCTTGKVSIYKSTLNLLSQTLFSTQAILIYFLNPTFSNTLFLTQLFLTHFLTQI